MILLLLAGCKKNVPTPSNTEMAVTAKGCSEVVVDNANLIVTAVLEEATDIAAVEVTSASVKINGKEVELSPSMVGKWDLRQPAFFSFGKNAAYDIMLIARQKMNLSFKVEGQIGDAVIDEANHRVLVNVTKDTKLSKISVLDMKLGPEGITTYSKGIDSPWTLVEPQIVEVKYHGRTVVWEIFAERSLKNVDFGKVSGWTRCAWVSASGVAGADNGFAFRKKGETEFTKLDASCIIAEGGSFKACIDNLEPQTEYEVYAYSGEDESDIQPFVTGSEDEIPNAGFNTYSNDESSKYYSFYDPKHTLWKKKWWDSGNSGSTAVGKSGVICAPDTDVKTEGTASARLNSRYIVIKFAAGNLFSGEFGDLVGMEGGKVNFGRPWTSRPRKLVFSVKHNNGAIDHMDGHPNGVKMGDKDICEVSIALGDWDYRRYGGTPSSPVQVNTTQPSTFMNPQGENVIAYGVYSASETADWHEVTIDLDYRDCFRVPTHIIISCAASKYGDYFTGCSSNTMWVDNMRLVY